MKSKFFGVLAVSFLVSALHAGSAHAGMKTMNGLTSVNGLTMNGLTSVNGLTMNGLTINGLTINGLTMNGLIANGLTLKTRLRVARAAIWTANGIDPSQPLSSTDRARR